MEISSTAAIQEITKDVVDNVSTTAMYPLIRGLTEHQLTTIATIDIFSTVFSIVGAASIIFIALLSKRLRDPEVLPIFLLAVADLLASVTLLAAVSLHIHKVKTSGYNTDVTQTCSTLAGFTVCFFIITFLLTICYALDIFIRMRESFRRAELFDETRRKTSGVVYVGFAISWLVPLLITTIISWFSSLKDSDEFNPILAPNEIYCQTCVPVFHDPTQQCSEVADDVLIWQPFYKFLFLAPLCCTLVVLLILYVAIYVVFRRSQVFGGILDFRQRDAARRVRNKAICYLSVFALCWLPTLIIGFLSLREFSMQQFFALYVIQALVCPLQGFFNSLIYGWQRQGFQQAVLHSRDVNSGSFSVTRPQSYGSIDM